MSPPVGRPRRAPHDAAEIVAAAIEIADRDGLEAVSIRRLAAHLDGRAMSFYDHFESKEELLGAMVEEAVAEVRGPLPEGWREGMATIARRIYATLVRHPWIVAVSGVPPRFGANSIAIARQMIEAASALGILDEEVWLAAGTINDYVVGHCRRIAAVPHDRRAAEVVPSDLIPAQELAATPGLASLPESLRTRDSIVRFEWGLQVVLDGIERRRPG